MNRGLYGWPGASPQAKGRAPIIDERVVNEQVPLIRFDNIPQNHRHLQVHFIGRITQNGGGDGPFHVRLNDDSGSNYDVNLTWLVGAATPGGLRASALTVAQMSLICDGDAVANAATSLTLTIYDYARTAWEKNMQCFGFTPEAHGTGIYPTIGGGHWRSTAAVVSVQLYAASSFFTKETVATLVGVS